MINYILEIVNIWTNFFIPSFFKPWAFESVDMILVYFPYRLISIDFGTYIIDAVISFKQKYFSIQVHKKS